MEEGPLLPKLRGYFAEFLREVSLARLSALTLTHLCRFTVRANQTYYETFLGNFSTDALRPKAKLSIRLPSRCVPLRHLIANSGPAQEYLTCCASATPYGLALAPG